MPNEVGRQIGVTVAILIETKLADYSLEFFYKGVLGLIAWHIDGTIIDNFGEDTPAIVDPGGN